MIYLSLTECRIIPYWVSSIIAGIFSLTVNFFVHKRWTFRSKEKENSLEQAALFVSASLMRMPANTILLVLLVENGAEHKRAQVFVTLFLGIVGFLVVRWIFRKKAKLTEFENPTLDMQQETDWK